MGELNPETKSDRKLLPLIKIITTRAFLFKLIILAILGLIFISIPRKYLGDSFPICLSRIILDKECIGCGTTRAVWSVLRFRFRDAYEFNKLIVITFPLLVGVAIMWLFKR